jgi:hypothetical protein
MSSRDPLDPARGWRFVEKLLAEDPERLDKASDESVERQMREQRVQPTRILSAEELVAKAGERAAKGRLRGERPPAGAGSGAANVVPMHARPKRAQWLTMLVAAALGALVLMVVMKRSDDNAASGQSARVRAEKLRDVAMKECAEARWSSCKDWLDGARRLDGAGETEPRVIEARRAIERATGADGGAR